MSPSDGVERTTFPAIGVAALVGFASGAWAAGPSVTQWTAVAALAIGTCGALILAASAVPGRRVGRPVRRPVRRPVLVVVSAAVWTAIGFGLSGLTWTGYASTLVVDERPVRVVGVIGAEAGSPGSGRGPVLRVPGGRLLLVEASGQIRAPAGTTVAVSGTVRPVRGDARTRERMRRSRVGGELLVDAIRVRSPPPWPAAAATAVRRHLRDAATSVGGGDRSAILLGLLTGDDSDMTPATRETFRDAGMSHLMAVSGSNLAVVAGAVAVSVSLLPIPRRARIAIVAVGVAAYVLVTRAEPSVVRAAVTATVALAAAWRGVLRDAARGFPATVLAIAVCDPWIVDAVGFQLSVVATAGILFAAVPCARWLPSRLPAVVRVAVAVTVTAQAAVLPLSAWHFGVLPLAGFVANLPAVPVAEAITLSGAVLAPLTFAVPELFVVLVPLLDALRWCATVFAALPFATLAVDRTTVVVSTALVVVAATAVARRRRRVSSRDADR